MKGTLRFHELHDELCNISNKVLSSTLRELISDGMVIRLEFECEHVNVVQYGLSEKGRSVIPILKLICEWSECSLRDPGDDSMGICSRCDHRNR
jgi:DNA-binding HxlR family transcriptional regulator